MKQLDNAEAVKEKWAALMEVREDVLKALEEAREDKVIGKSLEALVTIVPKNEKIFDILKETENLHQYFIVSEVRLEEANQLAKAYEHVSVAVEEHPGEKCQRCWVSSETIGNDPNYPDLCERCAPIVEDMRSE